MDIERCYEILDVDKDSPPEKIKEAYQDVINVWHPDRFSSSPRLKEKAENKVKEINVAYETLQSYMPARQQQQGPARRLQRRAKKRVPPARVNKRE